jgi:hypothetical protein
MMDDASFTSRVRELAVEATAAPAPADAWERIQARLRNGEEVLLPVAAAVNERRRFQSSARVAAVLLLAAGIGGAAALPASPVRQWLSQLFPGGSTEPAAGAVAPPAAADATAADIAARTTLIVDPLNGGVVITFVQPSPGVHIRVRLDDASGVEVLARGAAAAAQFRSARGQLTITAAAGGDVLLTIPHQLTRLSVIVDGQPYLSRLNGRIQILAPAADTAGAEIIIPISD